MAAESNSYEEVRRQRVQQNLKHLEDLGILRISKRLLEVAKSENKLLKCHSPQSKKNFETSELRRSSRARNLVPSYHDEVADIGHRNYRKRNSKNQNAARAYTGRIASYGGRARAIERAEKLQRDLKSCNPSFVKSMVLSHVSSCFWLGLPSKFCKENLPPHELRMVLEDEKGLEYDAIYIGNRAGLSGGWKGFATDHNLEDGDALVFELSEPARFKIYIVKAIEEESSEDMIGKIADEDIDGTTAATKTTKPITQEEDLSFSQKQPLKTGPVKQAGRATKRKHK